MSERLQSNEGYKEGVNWKYLLFVAAALIAAFCAQEFLQGIEAFSNARLLLVHTVFFVSALSVSFPWMLGLAFVVGLIWDARYVPFVQAYQTVEKEEPILALAQVVTGAESAGFGQHIILLALLGVVIHGVRPSFQSGQWAVAVLFIGVVVGLLLFFEYAILTFRYGNFYFPDDFWVKWITPILMSMVVAPLLLWLFRKVAVKCGYRTRREGIFLPG